MARLWFIHYKDRIMLQEKPGIYELGRWMSLFKSLGYSRKRTGIVFENNKKHARKKGYDVRQYKIELVEREDENNHSQKLTRPEE